MPEITISLSISREQWLDYYSGVATDVITTYNGKKIAFPASVLRSYVTHSGVHGDFVISYDLRGKFRKIKKI